MLHLMNHAIFKALLFLAAGAVIYIAHHTKDAWKLGGLIKQAPFVAIFMAMGSMSLAGIPPFSGFFSKDMVLAEAISNSTPFVSTLVTIAGLLSIAYITRLWVLIFLGNPRDEDIAGHVHAPGNLYIRLPLGILAFITLGIALYQHNAVEYIVGHPIEEPHVKGLLVGLLLGMATLFAIVVGLYVKGMNLLQKISQHRFMQVIHQVLFNGYFVEAGITYLSKNVIVNGVAKSIRWVDTNIIDWLVNATVPFARGVFRGFRIGHTGRIGDYMGTFAIGVALIVVAILIIVEGV